MCHPRDSWKDFLVKMLPLCLLFSQLTIPLALLLSQLETYDGGFCPNTGTRNEKILMFSIATMYTARSTLVFYSKYEQWGSLAFLHSNECMPVQAIEIISRWELRIPMSILNWWGQIDDFMNVQYEGLLYLLNLWLVFISQTSIDMVLNSLAMEMVMKLDDEFKEYYFKANGQATMYVLKNNLHSIEYDREHIKELPYNKYFLNYVERIVINYGTRITFIAVPFIAAVTALYSPFCK